MIEVKGTQNSAADSDAPRDRYVLKDAETFSKWPIAFGLFLTGLAVYLKSIFPAIGQWGSEPADRHDDVTEGQDHSSARPELTVVAEAPAGHDAVGGGSTFEPGNSRYPRSGVAARSIDSFMSADSRPIDFNSVDPMDGFRHQGVRPPFVKPQAGNDNAAPGAGNTHPDAGGGASPRDDFSDGNHEDEEDIAASDDGENDPGESDQSGQDGDDEDENAPRNRAPTVGGPVYLHDLSGCHAVLITLTALLAGASDPDGDALSIANLSVSSGALTQTDGGWLYTPAEGVLGNVTLSYDITDGALSVRQLAYLEIVEAPPIVGSAGDDLLLGTTCGDRIDGRDGDDNIDGRSGNDVIAGGQGDDHIIAGTGHDVVFAGDGDDVVLGQAGDDIIFGGRGNDRLFGGDGDDTIFGEDGHDLIIGGAGSDILMGGSGGDVIHAEAGNDVLDGGDGSDLLHAGAGDDSIEGGDGDDLMSGGDGADIVGGGAGNDRIEASADNARDSYDGGAGTDTLDCSGTQQGVEVDLDAGVAVGIEIGTDTISGFEAVIGGDGDDTFIVGTTACALTGGHGEDAFVFVSSTRPVNEPAAIHEILDLMVGDRIVVGEYEIFEAGNEEQPDRFEQIYGDEGGDDRPFRFRHEVIDDKEHTFIEASGDNAQTYDFSIHVHGYHRLYIAEMAE